MGEWTSCVPGGFILATVEPGGIAAATQPVVGDVVRVLDVKHPGAGQGVRRGHLCWRGCVQLFNANLPRSFFSNRLASPLSRISRRMEL